MGKFIAKHILVSLLIFTVILFEMAKELGYEEPFSYENISDTRQAFRDATDTIKDHKLVKMLSDKDNQDVLLEEFGLKDDVDKTKEYSDKAKNYVTKGIKEELGYE
jgi:hypothetical protein